MPEEQRLQQKIAEYRQRWEKLSELLAALRDARILETRAEEKLRLKTQIDERETERQTLEAEWQALETGVKRIQKARLMQDALKLENNKAYPEAIQTWREIGELDPEDSAVVREIERLAGMPIPSSGPIGNSATCAGEW